MTHYLRALAARLRGLFGDRRADRELDEEIETHLRLLTVRYVCQGMTEAEAARAPPPVRERHIAAGGASRNAWNQTRRDAFTGFETWPSRFAQESGVYRRRRLITRVGHRREPDDLQFRGCVFLAAYSCARA